MVKGLAELMYQDVSEDKWDQTNLTREKLNYSNESLYLVNEYVNRLKGTDLLNKNVNTFSIRIGAYIGEVIRKNINDDYHWYEYTTVEHLIPKAHNFNDYIKTQQVIYSKKNNRMIVPMYEVYNYFLGNFEYKDLYSYVTEMIEQNSS
ncbi:hypothetical protein LIT25_11895 [Bacillus sp. F19]|nr:hypothetical protein LIT25_11895 [Bacillus sp. F19]